MGKLNHAKSSEVAPYLAALYRKEVHFCTGSMISPKHILTAAKCMEEFFMCEYPDFSKHYAWVGSFNLKEGGIIYDYEQVEIHKDYNFEYSDYIYNIGLITVLIKTYLFKRIQYFLHIYNYFSCFPNHSFYF